jgi:hypothetical protein
MKLTAQRAICSLGVLALGMTFVAASSAALIDDDLNVDTSASYSEVALGADHQVLWAYDYSGTVGSAPNTTDASTIGVRITANRTAAAASAATLFHNTPIPANARVTVDLYMGVTGSGGTTEFGSVGIGSTGNTPFTIFSPIAGDGTYYTHTGDGGSSSDWRWSRPGGTDPSASVPVNNTSTTYLLGGTDAPLYDGCCGLIVDPINGNSSGVGGNQWITLSIAVNNGTSKITINGEKVVDGPSIGDADDLNTGGNAPGGLASFSYADVFSSVASPGDSQFGIFDNFKVEAIPEPSSVLLLGLGALGLGALRRQRR